MAGEGDDRGKKPLFSRFLSGTALGAQRLRPRIPDNVMSLFRYMAEEEPPKDKGESAGLYESVKRRFNRIWSGRDAYAATEPDPSPVSRFKTLRGALTAYWTGEKWAEAYRSSGAVLGVATLNAMNTVWLSEAAAGFVSAVADLTIKAAPHAEAAQALQERGLWLGGLGALYIAGSGVQDFLKMNMQRRMAGWMTGRFNEAVLAKPDTIYRITHNRDDKSAAPDAMPDGPHQRMSSAIGQAVRQFTDISVGAWASVMTSLFAGVALYRSSVPVEFLDNMGRFLNEKFPNGVIDFVPGDAGTFALAMTTVAAYSALMYPLAMKFGRRLENTGNEIQKAGAAHTETLVKMFSRGQALAESGGNVAQKKILDKVYHDVDKAWHDDNVAMTKYMTYSFLQGFMGYHLVSIVPGLAGAVSRTLDFKGFMTSQLYTGSMLQSVGYFFNMIPNLKGMKAAVGRINGMAGIIDLVQDRKKFYELSGTHDFKFKALPAGDSGDIMRIDGMALYHRGQTEPFLHIDGLAIGRGDQILVEGESGCGKSSWFRAIAGTFPYGRGDISVAPGTSLFFARQKTDIDPHLTLADQVVYGGESIMLDFSPDPERIQWALRAAGLGQFSDNAESLTHEGKSWPEILSGGQEQRLVLARILYQKPDLLLLDEATSALNPAARREFFRTLRQQCPGTTVLAIMHSENAAAEFAYNKKLSFANGTAVLEDSGSLPAPQVAAAQEIRL